MQAKRIVRRRLRRKFKKLSKEFFTACHQIAHGLKTRSEVKIWTVNYNGQDLTTTGTFGTMDNVAAGTANYNRIGNEVILLGVRLKGMMYAEDYVQSGRMIMCNCKDGYTANAPDITESGLWYGETRQLVEDITVYSDKYIGFSAPSQILSDTSSYASKPITMTKYFKKGLRVKWNSVPHIENNSIEMLMYSDSSAGNGVQLTGNLTFLFIDP